MLHGHQNLLALLFRKLQQFGAGTRICDTFTINAYGAVPKHLVGVVSLTQFYPFLES